MRSTVAGRTHSLTHGVYFSMSKSVILTVDDDPQVLRAVTRDLRKKFTPDYRIVSADNGQSALETCHELQSRGDTVALFLVDQRMPGMSGTEFLQEARDLFPDARRVLLTAYADTSAAIEAINSVRLHHYLLKPWEPPEENLYPVLVDELEDWKATNPPPFDGIRVIGFRWNADSHRVKDFLARNQFPYTWMDVQDDAEACSIYTGEGEPRLPLIILPEGNRLENPPTEELAERLGLKTRAEGEFYDFVIVGGGPAGLAAAVYGASEGLKTLLVEREAPGGQAGTSSKIENYLGFPEGLSGKDLARRAVAQAARFGVEMLSAEAVGLEVDNQYRRIKLKNGAEVVSHAVLIANGVSYRKLDAPGVEDLTGRGVYYGAALTEALSCKGDPVFVVGGANSAGQGAVYLSEHASCVTMLVRSSGLEQSMSQYLIDEIARRPNIRVLPYTTVQAAHGTDSLDSITILNSETGECEKVPARALFIFIGAAPRTEWLENTLERDKHGFLLAGPELSRRGKLEHWPLQRDPFLLECNVPGVFVAGDVRAGSVKRVASGVGEGSIAVSFVHQYLANVK